MEYCTNFGRLDWLKLIYFAFVYPYILYGVEIYANTFITYLDTLTKLNNKILRIILNQPFRSHTLDLYRQCDLLTLNYLHTHQLHILVFKCLYHRHLVPSTFQTISVIIRIFTVTVREQVISKTQSQHP